MIPIKNTHPIDRGNTEDDYIYLGSIFESRKDVPTNKTWMHYMNNEASYYDDSTNTLHRYTSGRLQAKI